MSIRGDGQGGFPPAIPSGRITRTFADGWPATAEFFRTCHSIPSIRRPGKPGAETDSSVDSSSLITGSATSRFNTWLYSSHFSYEKCTHTQKIVEQGREWSLSWLLKWPGMTAQATTRARSLREAKEKISILFLQLLRVQVQMDAPLESVQGREIAESDKSSNTIVTRDAEQTLSTPVKLPAVIDHLSSELAVSFPEITSRWLPLPVLTISASQGQATTVVKYDFPTDLFSLAPSVINILPFRSFIYSDFACEIKFVVNANRFQCGKLIASVRFDPVGLKDYCATIQGALARPHIILDLSTNAEGVLDVPFKFHRGLVMNLSATTKSHAFSPGRCVQILVQVLSPLATGAGSVNDMNIRPFVKLKGTGFFGMSHQIDTQMDPIAMATAVATSQSVRDVVLNAGRVYRGGTSDNNDKPSSLEALSVVPRPRLGFCLGKGSTDIVPLRNDAFALTSFASVRAPDDEPKSVLDIARIWGLRDSFKWTAASAANVRLYSMPITPGITKKDRTVLSPSPLDYVCGMYNFWSGTIEVRLDFVSTAFHTGSIMVALQFGRPLSDEIVNWANVSSSYTKTFHLGEQKSFVVTIPYIYDTPMQRSCAGAVNTAPIDQVAKDVNYVPSDYLSIVQSSRTLLSVWVVNALRPVPSVAQSIDVLVFWRASPNFQVHGLCQSSWVPDVGHNIPMDNFPGTTYTIETPHTPTGNGSLSRSHHIQTNNVETQMDSGEKEVFDHTADFSVGLRNLSLTSYDDQTSIKDILRRPVMILHRQLVQGYADLGTNNPKFIGFFVPCVPPNTRMCPGIFNKFQPSVWSPNIPSTPQAALLSCFKFWRGSLRYTIIAHSASSEPIYVTYVPHTGVRILGNKQHTHNWVHYVLPFMAGLATEIIIPSVNPTVQVEVPYETENTWTQVLEDDPNSKLHWRDKSDFNAGHLVIASQADVSVTVWLAVGDDFAYANFLGVPLSVNSRGWYLSEDDQPGERSAFTQMDFPESDSANHGGTISSIKQAFGRVLTPTNMVRALATQVPVVGPAYVAAEALQKTDEVCAKVDEVSQELTSTLLRSRETMGCIDNFVQLMESRLVPLLQGMTTVRETLSEYLAVVRNALIAIVGAIVSRSWAPIGVGIAQIFCAVFPFKLTELMAPAADLGRAIGGVFSPETQAPLAPVSKGALIAGSLMAMIGTVMRVELLDKAKFTSRAQGLLSSLTTTSGVGYVNQCLTLVTRVFDLLKDMVCELLGLVDPEVRALELLCSKRGYLNDFIKRSQMLTNEFNKSQMLMPAFRHMAFKTIMDAYQIQRAVTLAPSNVASANLLKQCNEVIKFSQEKNVRLTCSPVRYEPFVICIEGPPGVGKSHMANTIIEALFAAIGYRCPHSGLVYTRQPGMTFWNNYSDQPCILYDEWLNMTTPDLLAITVKEFYQLKSKAVFIPDMAAIEDKSTIANPVVVLTLTNDAFPNSLSNVTATSEAVLRRRELVMRVELKPEYQNEHHDLSSVPPEVLEEYGHLTFQFYSNVRDGSSLGGPILDFQQNKAFVQAKFMAYHERELADTQVRMRRFYSSILDRPVSETEIGDPFATFYSIQNQVLSQDAIRPSTWVPWDDLVAACEQLSQIVGDTPDLAVEQPPASENVETQVDDSLWDVTCNFGKMFVERVARLDMFDVVRMVSHPLESLFGEERFCCGCQASKVCMYECTATTGCASAHAVCNDCYTRGKFSSHNICPMCRGYGLEPKLPHGLKQFIIVAQWVCAKIREIGPCVIKQFVKVLRCNCLRLISNILATSSLILSLYHRDVPAVVSTLALRTVAHGIQDHFEDASDRSLEELHMMQGVENDAQMDRSIPDASSSTGSNSHTHLSVEEDSSGFRINESAFASVGNVVTQPTWSRCFHCDLVDKVFTARYHSSPTPAFQTFANILGIEECIRVPESACQYPDCPFRCEETRRQFYQDFGNMNRPFIANQLAQAINGESSNLVRIPRVLQPEWRSLESDFATQPWWEYLSEKYNDHKRLIYVCIAISGAVAAIVSGYKLFAMCSTAVAAQASICSSSVSNTGTNRSIRVASGRARVPNRVPSRGYYDDTYVQESDLLHHISSHVIRNYVSIGLWEKGAAQPTKVVTCVGICGRKAMLPRHYLPTFKKWHADGNTFTVEPSEFTYVLTNHLRVVYAFDSVDFVEVPDTDLAIWTLPRSFKLFKDIRKYFWTDEDVAKGFSPDADLIVPPTNLDRKMMAYQVDILGHVPCVRATGADGLVYTQRDCLEYNFSKRGACGAILLSQTSQRPIMGMHVSGNQAGTGYSLIITQEALEQLRACDTITQMEDLSLLPITEDTKAFIIDDPTCALHYLGVVPDREKPHVPHKSKIIKSRIHKRGGLEPQTFPTILSRVDPRYTHIHSPLWYGVRKHGLLSVDFTTTQLKRAAQALWDRWLSRMKPSVVSPKRLTPQEAVVGNVHIDHYDPMKLITSAGYPFCLTPGKTTKEAWITAMRDKNQTMYDCVIHPDVLSVLEERTHKRRQGLQTATLFVDTLKDERKPLDKVLKEGGTRVFCNAPVDHTIAMRQNFLHFMAAYTHARLGVMSGVGINPMGPEWTSIFQHLSQVSVSNCYSIDYSNFGPAFNAGVAEMAKELIIKWTVENVSGVNTTELNALLSECTQSLHIADNTVYQQYCGSPSGASITTIINSLVNSLYILLCWDALCATEARLSDCDIWAEFERNVALVVYGDDLIMTVSDKYNSLFNAATIQAYLAVHKITATDANKTSDEIVAKPIVECSFLKRGFRPHPVHHGLWLAPLKWDSINDATQWIWQCPNHKIATELNIEAALLQAHGHGPAKFEEFLGQINKALREVKMKPVSMTWQDVDSKWFEGSIEWFSSV